VGKGRIAMEAVVPVIMEDFDIGSRVFYENSVHGHILFGRVTKVVPENVFPGFVIVKLDTGNILEVTMDEFSIGRPPESNITSWWVKSIEFAELTEGSLLSFLNQLGERRYARVIEFVLGHHLVLDYLHDDLTSTMIKKTYYGKETGKMSLEYQLRYFELEG
jgi:hypothetical protein